MLIPIKSLSPTLDKNPAKDKETFTLSRSKSGGGGKGTQAPSQQHCINGTEDALNCFKLSKKKSLFYSREKMKTS